MRNKEFGASTPQTDYAEHTLIGAIFDVVPGTHDLLAGVMKY